MLTHRSRTILGAIPTDWDAKPLRTLITEQFAGDWGDDDGEQAVAVSGCPTARLDGVALRRRKLAAASATGWRIDETGAGRPLKKRRPP